MKTIGILTFHYPTNYGALLQTYGLKKYLENKEFNVQIINYYTNEHKSRYNFLSKTQNIKGLISNIIRLPFYFKYLSKNNKFDEFRKEHFNLTRRFKSIIEIDFIWDIVLTGSDQVFNINYDDRNVYFQDFPKRPNQIKAAYAPSFGLSTFNDEIKSMIESWVLDFDYISCREREGAEFLQEVLNRPVENVLDPVFLLNATDWIKISNRKLVQGKYIFIYDLNGKKPLVDIALSIKRKDQKIVLLSNDILARIKPEYRGVDLFIETAGIKDFISLVRYSDSIVTDSFHGVAMSLVFEKPFYVYIALKKAAGRITSLLENLELLHRIVSPQSIKHMNSDKFTSQSALSLLVNKSKSFLDSICISSK